jgi:hypothetical protein
LGHFKNALPRYLLPLTPREISTELAKIFDNFSIMLKQLTINCMDFLIRNSDCREGILEMTQPPRDKLLKSHEFQMQAGEIDNHP